MAIIEVNLEKPALVEEYQYPSQSPADTPKSTDSKTESDSSGRSKAKILGLLGVLAGLGLLVWKLKTRGGSEQTDFEDFDDEYDEQEYDHGPEPEIGGDESESDQSGAKGKVAGLLGLVVGVVGLLAAVQKFRN